VIRLFVVEDLFRLVDGFRADLAPRRLDRDESHYIYISLSP
jgi:hypothetical protein